MRQPLRQWVLKITAYADRLADDLEACGVEWPEGTKTAQENWIGRSEGALTPLTLTPTITLTPTPTLTLTLTLTPPLSLTLTVALTLSPSPSPSPSHPHPHPHPGAYVDFGVSPPTDGAAAKALADEVIKVFTTRPDTLMGATY